MRWAQAGGPEPSDPPVGAAGVLGELPPTVPPVDDPPVAAKLDRPPAAKLSRIELPA
jgi:hypothetical protein